MKAAAKPQAKTQPQNAEARPTITLDRVIASAPDTASFGGWGPKVAGFGQILKSWN